jgi:hypothetical protein
MQEQNYEVLKMDYNLAYIEEDIINNGIGIPVKNSSVETPFTVSFVDFQDISGNMLEAFKDSIVEKDYKVLFAKDENFLIDFKIHNKIKNVNTGEIFVIIIVKEYEKHKEVYCTREGR